MIAIMCIDDKCGMLFNNRRQSRDITVLQKIKELSKESTLRMNSYSKKLFEDSDNICVSDTFLSECKEDEFAFVETESLLPFESVIKKLIIFKWNCVYPQDMKMDIDLAKWKISSSEDFIGNSHEKITMEVYER